MNRRLLHSEILIFLKYCLFSVAIPTHLCSSQPPPPPRGVRACENTRSSSLRLFISSSLGDNGVSKHSSANGLFSVCKPSFKGEERDGRDNQKKLTVVTTTFGPTIKLISDRVVQEKKQETWRGLAENCKKQSQTFNSTEAHESGSVSKNPKKTQKKDLAALIGPSKLPTKYTDKIREMRGRDLTLVMEKTLAATDMDPCQSGLSIPKLQRSELLQLKKWSYGSKTFSRALAERWNRVSHPYKPNGLEKDAIVQLWSFRMDDNLCFCLDG
ncbi:hypothetical protein ACJRO7_034427 [Eucalyptus globulus]|uniref:Uncharacterized protein n=1 Tax=Eucalyptus globulus TaxID=34317 RepID=A0ABD3JCE8_EUCGL